MKIGLLTALLAVLCVSTPAAETYEIEKWAVGAVGLGWAGFGAALAGPTEFMINPAGLADAEWSNIDVGFFSKRVRHYDEDEEKDIYLDTIEGYFFSFIKPMRMESVSLGKESTFGTLAISINFLNYLDNYYSYEDFINYNNEASESLATISFGSQVSDFFSYGINFKVLGIETNDNSDNGFGLDLGVKFNVGIFKAGLSITNSIPPGVSLTDNRSYLDRTLRLGVGLSYTVDLSRNEKSFTCTPSLGLDIEYNLNANDYNIGIYGNLFKIEEKPWGLTFSCGYNFNKSFGVYIDMQLFFLLIKLGVTEIPASTNSELVDNMLFSFSLCPDI